MRGVPVAVLALVACATLAGCSGGGTASADGAADPSKGALRGVVVDDGVRPLAGVTVLATAGETTANATTGADGLFELTDLEPGLYVVTASKPRYIDVTQSVAVEAGVEAPLTKLQMANAPGQLAYANVYKYEGFLECGVVARLCANINIATWIVLCANTNVCIGNVTTDRSLFFQPIDPGPTFIQAELDWQATNPLGESLVFLVGGGNEAELRSGMASTYNYTSGVAPLMTRVHNHHGEDAWCRNVPDPPCEERALEQSRIGTERALMAQVDPGPTVPFGQCVADAYCGLGASFLQTFTMYTTVFFGYEPAEEWLFTATGEPPLPPDGG